MREQNESLKKENEEFVQHQNFKQKLQYHVKIKKENNELREENAHLLDEVTRLKRKYEPHSLD